MKYLPSRTTIVLLGACAAALIPVHASAQRGAELRPEIRQFEVQGGESRTAARSIHLASDVRNATHYRISEDSTFSGVTWQQISQTTFSVTHMLREGAGGRRLIYLQARAGDAEPVTISTEVQYAPVLEPPPGCTHVSLGNFVPGQSPVVDFWTTLAQTLQEKGFSISQINKLQEMFGHLDATGLQQLATDQLLPALTGRTEAEKQQKSAEFLATASDVQSCLTALGR